MQKKETQKELWQQEIRDTEQAFAEMVAQEGIHKAFTTFAAPEAVLMRNNKLIEGLDGIDAFYKGNNAKGLVWKPDFVEVSEAGDMAYTYGKYTFTYLDESGIEQEDKGVFHTVWKRQADGKWKFVWD